MLSANHHNKTPLRFCLLFTYALGLVFTNETVMAGGNGQAVTPSPSVVRKQSGSICGLYCLYAAMQLSGHEVEPSELFKLEYVGSAKGSSLGELRNAAEDNGLYAEPIGKLTGRELHNCHYPVILHVKLTATSMDYNHYELFLGTENGQAKLFDPPNPVSLVPFCELAPQWDGNGLIVSAEPIDLGAVFAPARKRFILYAAIVIAIILALYWAKRLVPVTLTNSRIKVMCLSIAQTTGFIILAVLIGMFYHFANGAGLLANANATASIQKAHQGNFIPKINEKKVHKLLNTDTVFIDARLRGDYEAGHLEGAISVPVDANDIER